MLWPTGAVAVENLIEVRPPLTLQDFASVQHMAAGSHLVACGCVRGQIVLFDFAQQVADAMAATVMAKREDDSSDGQF
jgi:hypothetical protein